MSSNEPLFIKETNLSHAWGRAFLHIIDNSGNEISPLLITLTGFKDGQPQEDCAIRDELDKLLTSGCEQKIHTVANTIFPASYWRNAKSDRHKLFDVYLNSLPRIKALAKSKNSRGLYFERLISFEADLKYGNQLEYIISQYRSSSKKLNPRHVRRSMFQASIFDPARDHTPSAQLGFPCLQHVSFVPNDKDKSLSINAFYATQQLFNKAYGNYLGLCRLGDFMAHEMGLTLDQMNCFVGVAKLNKIGKRDSSLSPLIQMIRNAVPKTSAVDGGENGE
jgi:hypothetical protein